MLPRTLPIFPLGNVVLFPSVFLPLHVFEPRYREMVRDALASDRMIGMVLLKPGFEAEYEGRPPVYAVGCAGLITHADRLENGRYNIVLRGVHRFRITGEDASRAYRIAHADPLPDPLPDPARGALRAERRRLEELLATVLESSADTRFPAGMPDEELVNALAQYLPIEPVERQALLEREGVLQRCQSLVELLEMKLLSSHQPWRSTAAN